LHIAIDSIFLVHVARLPVLRICITAFNAYPAIEPAVGGRVGGVETRAWTFARALAQLPDTEVTFVVRHSAPLECTTVEGVKLIALIDPLFPMREAVSTMIGRTPRFPWIQLRGWNRSLVWQAPIVGFDFLKRRLLGRKIDYQKPMEPIASVDADVYVTFGVVNMTSASVIASAHARNRPAVLFLGSDSDLDERFTPDSSFVSPYGDPAPLCAWIIAQADQILAQTPSQAERLRRLFGREAEIIPNPIDHLQWDEQARSPLPDAATAGLSRYVLWVGRAEGVHKRPQLMVEVAKSCPDVDFLMVLNPREPVLEDRIGREAPGNLRIVSHVPYSQMPALFTRAAALVSTSSLEGFPNVFLQAALSRTPIGSLVVAEEFLQKSQAGECFDGNLEALARWVRTAWVSPQQESRREVARDYVIQHHGLKAQTAAFRAALERISRPQS
jgi:hypothetical protein